MVEEHTRVNTPFCHQCKLPFQTWEDYKQHVISSPKTAHPFKTRVWAHKFANNRVLRPKREYKTIDEDPDYKPTKFGDENRKKRFRQLSGIMAMVPCYCPWCKKFHIRKVEIEYLRDQDAWMINGKPVIICDRCRQRRNNQRRRQ